MLKGNKNFMSWIPDPHQALSLFKRIEAEDDPLVDSSHLFWLFCTSSMPHQKFLSRMTELKESHLVLKGKFNDPEIHTIMTEGFKNPDKVAQAVVNRLDILSQMKKVPYRPDFQDDPERLYAYTHIEASRLFRFLKTEAYSERTREVLENALNSYSRCSNIVSSYSEAPWTEEYSASLEAVASFLYISQFYIKKVDGDYEDALSALAQGIAHGQLAYLLYTMVVNSNRGLFFLNEIGDFRYATPWMRELEPQVTVDCFEALRIRGVINDPKALAGICDLLAHVSTYLWSGDDGTLEVKDIKGDFWNSNDYWQNASGWVEAQLQPSQFKELINEREDQAAEKRLKTYFFDEELWVRIPDRAKRCLISADRDWFSGTGIRIESILNNLSIATEEVLSLGIWKQLEQWVDSHNIKTQDKKFLNLQKKLTIKSGASRLRVLANMCKTNLTKEYLEFLGLPEKEIEWFTNKLPARIHELHDKRNIAEHEAGIEWSRNDIQYFYDLFLGIGEYGIFPRLCRAFLK